MANASDATRISSASRSGTNFRPVEIMEFGTPGKPAQALFYDGSIYVYNTAGQTLIESGQVTTNGIQAQAVTTAKLTVGSVTDTILATNSVTSDKIYAASVTSAKIGLLAVGEANIAALAVTNAKIANTTITGAKIANATIDTTQIANAAIENAKIANLAVTNAKIANTTITGAKIANATIDTAQIANAAIENAKIANLAVTNAKINDLSASKINAGTMSFNYASGGTLTLGGSGNGNGVFSLKNSGGTEVVSMNNTGVTVKSGGNYYIDNGGMINFKEGGEMRMTTSSGYVSGNITNYAYAATPYKVCTFSTHQYAAQTSGPTFNSTSAGSWEFYLGNRHIAASKFGRVSIYATDIMMKGRLDLSELIGISYVTVNVGASSGGTADLTHNWGTSNVVALMCNEQTGGGYMDYVFTSFDVINTNQVRIYVRNTNTSNTATGTIRVILFTR